MASSSTADPTGSFSATPTARGPVRVARVRWAICVLLGVGILINYIDRVNISLAATPLTDEFHIDAGKLGIVFSSFLWSYALFQIPAGLLLDKIGVKWIMRICAIVWSAACFLTAIASGLGLVLVARLLLGVAEAPGFPAAMKATGYWFPRSERGLATAIFDTGGRLSNVIGAPLVGLAIAVFGWRGAFWASGLLSVVFVVLFWIFYRNPSELRRSGRLSSEEHRYILDGGAQLEDAHIDRSGGVSFGYILRQRKVWGLALGLSCAGYVSWTLLTWLPGFLQKDLGLSVAQSGIYTAIPWAFAVIFELSIAGWLVDRLVRRGHDETLVRKGVLIAGMVIATFVVGAAFVHTTGLVTFFITLGTVGISLAFSVSNSLPSLIAPEGSVARVGGFVNFVNILVGIAAPIVTGFLVQATGSFIAAFVVCGVFLVVGIFFYVVILGRIATIPAPAADSRQAG